jgi:hypothetical protein
MTLPWTDLPALPDARIVHVHPEGSDTHDGYSPEEPLRTFTAGLTRIRPGAPDQLLAARGEVFGPESTPAGGVRWIRGGAGPNAKSVFGAYGPTHLPRPKLVTSGKPGFALAAGAGTPNPVRHVAVDGIEFDAGDRMGLDQVGIRVQANAEDVLVQDVKVRGYFDGLVAQMPAGMVYDLTVRGSVFHDCYSVLGGKAAGIYADEVTRLVLEGVVVDNVGRNATDVFMHGLYIQGDSRNVTIRDTFVSRCSSHGAQLRFGGVLDRCFFIDNAIGFLHAGDGSATRNVVTEACDIDPTDLRRWACDVQNVPTGARIAGNVFVHTAASLSSRGMQIQPLEYPSGTWLGSHNVTTEDNVMFGWGGNPYRVTEPPGAPPGSSIHTNLVEAASNRWHPAAETLVDPTLTAGAYSALVGGAGTRESLIAECLRQGRYSWRTEYSTAEIVRAFRRAYAHNAT